MTSKLTDTGWLKKFTAPRSASARGEPVKEQFSCWVVLLFFVVVFFFFFGGGGVVCSPAVSLGFTTFG